MNKWEMWILGRETPLDREEPDSSAGDRVQRSTALNSSYRGNLNKTEPSWLSALKGRRVPSDDFMERAQLPLI